MIQRIIIGDDHSTVVVGLNAVAMLPVIPEMAGLAHLNGLAMKKR